MKFIVILLLILPLGIQAQTADDFWEDLIATENLNSMEEVITDPSNKEYLNSTYKKDYPIDFFLTWGVELFMSDNEQDTVVFDRILQYFIKSGIDLNGGGKRNHIYRMLEKGTAYEYFPDYVVKKLLDSGMDLFAGKPGNRPMDYILDPTNYMTSFMETLIVSGVDVNEIHEGESYNIVAGAVVNDYYEMLEILVFEEGLVDFNKRFFEGKSGLLDLAMIYSTEDVFNLLLTPEIFNPEARCDVCAHETYLHRAAWRGNATHAYQLVESMVDIESVDNEGRTPLYYAVFYNNLEVAEELLEMGANQMAADSNGKTILQLVKEKKNKKMRQLFAYYSEDD